MCHRSHSAPADTQFFSPESNEMTGSALILGDEARGERAIDCQSSVGRRTLSSAAASADVSDAFCE